MHGNNNTNSNNHVLLPPLESSIASVANATKSASIYSPKKDEYSESVKSSSADLRMASNEADLLGFVVPDPEVAEPLFPANIPTGPPSPNQLSLVRYHPFVYYERQRAIPPPNPITLQPPNIIHYGPQYNHCNLNYHGNARDIYIYI